MPKVSVIVPIYNAEEYLLECIDSILQQTFCDFELILVDDGSPDSSGSICDEYAQKDNRIQVIHQSNGGVTSARAAGVSASQAEWITFVDADDTLPSDALYQMCLKTNETSDIIIGAMDDRVLPHTITIRDYRSACIAGTVFSTALWAKMYRRSLFNDWVFDIPREIKVGEDLLMNVRLSFRTRLSPLVLPATIVYNYRSNPQSVMHQYIYTLDSAERRLSYLKLSIPDAEFEEYRYDYDKNVWRLLSVLVYDNPDDNSWRGSSMYLYFKDEINSGRFKMTLSQKMALWPRNKWQLRIVNKLTKFLP